MFIDEALAEQITDHLRMLVVAFGLIVVTVGIAWQRGFFCKPAPFYVPIQGKNVLQGFLFFTVAEILLVPALFVVLDTLIEGKDPGSSLHRPEIQRWLNSAIVLGGGAAVWVAFLHLPRSQRRLIWGNSKYWYKDLFVGIATWFVSYPIVLAIDQMIAIATLLLFQQPQVDQVAVKHLKSSLADPVLFGLVVMSITTIVPVVEEFLFRALLQSWLKEKLPNRIWAVMVTSLIFAFFHFSSSQGISNIELLFSLFILSCFLGFIYEKQQSLWAPIGLHAFFNTMSILMIINTEQTHNPG